MLFLGTLDDKTLEYPNGSCSEYKPSLANKLLINILFNDKPIVLEEGFVLAAAEAVAPNLNKPILLPAIGSGLIKVISRDGNMLQYASQRRANKHAAPPDTVEGRAYINDLQKACDNVENIYSGNAYLQYPPKEVDEFTYQRFIELFEKDEVGGLLDCLDIKLPKQYLNKYEKMYRQGNKGGQWTARAAWEELAKNEFGEQSPLTHFLMIKANRERQIIRAAATAQVNKTNFWLETGFDLASHDLVEVASTNNRTDMLKETGIPIPQISIDSLQQYPELLFSKLSDPSSNLSSSRNAYLSQIRKPVEKIDMNELSVASQRYENDILSAINSTPLEVSEKSKYVELGTGIVLGAAAEKLFSYFMKPVTTKEELTFDQGVGLPRNKNVLDRLMTRRGFFAMFAGTAVMYGWGQLNSEVSPNVKTVMRSGRVNNSYDTKDEWLAVLKQQTISNQLLKVNMSNVERIIRL